MLDLDGVIFPTYDELDILHKALFKKGIDFGALADKDDPYWLSESGLWLKKMFDNDLFYAELRSYKGAREVLRIFMRDSKNQILYCTARSPVLEEATAYSLGLNKLPYGNLIFVDRKDAHLRKLEIAVLECPDIIIDDESRTLFAVREQCPITICFTQSYNVKYPFGLRANSWLEIGEQLKYMQENV